MDPRTIISFICMIDFCRDTHLNNGRVILHAFAADGKLTIRPLSTIDDANTIIYCNMLQDYFNLRDMSQNVVIEPSPWDGHIDPMTFVYQECQNGHGFCIRYKDNYVSVSSIDYTEERIGEF
jgi:hypothetical protein